MKLIIRTKILFLALALISGCRNETATDKYKVETFTEEGYTYKTVSNDPLGLRIYSLKNGLKVYLSVNKDAPRIQTVIAVKAGSSYDPPETTGLAHYLEHMVFKGTDKMGTINWKQEEELLNLIENLYEQHRNTDDQDLKKNIYKKIDSVSQAASKFAIANEYDKMVSSIGANNTNAFTSTEVTAYINDIPSNEFEKWLMLEKERFGKLVLRLFHTELEAVYEEFNRNQDNDSRKMNRALDKALFPNHPYGTQTTIGTSEHLKNPSMKKIKAYFDKYYVPNNMAVCIAGDIDPAKTIKLIDKYFGGFEKHDVPEHKLITAGPIEGIVVKNVLGPDKESVNIGFRFDGVNSSDEKTVAVIDMILSNYQAGIIDLDLVQKQKILQGGAYPSFDLEYGAHVLYGSPREGQKLEEVKDLLLSALEKVKKGDFGDWLIPAIINDLQLERMKQNETNNVAYDYLNSFIYSTPWIDEVRRIDDLAAITKAKVVEFASKHYTNNYVIVYKRLGKDTTIAKVEKPPITPMELNRKDESGFMKEFNGAKSENIKPVFVNYKDKIKRKTLGSAVELSYIKNTTNELFNLTYLIDMGQAHNKKLALAVNYLPFLGTTNYSPAQLQEEFYKLGISMNVSTGQRRSYVFISGLEKSLEQGIKLLEHVIAEVQPDRKTYNEYVDGILKKRADNKLNKGQILHGGLRYYGTYGSKSPFTDVLSEKELRAIDPAELTAIIKKICSYKHYLFYYGKNDVEYAGNVIDKYHTVKGSLLDYPDEKKYPELDIFKNKVNFAHYDMVQAEILILAKDEIFNKDFMPYAEMFGSYFGSGLSSIMFQEIRESKGLAYSAYAAFSIPGQPDKYHYVSGYVGTQVNKLSEAVPAALKILRTMPEAEKQFNAAKESIIKNIETERITKSSIFWSYLSNKDRGIDYDVRKDIYDKVQTMTMQELNEFFNAHIKRDHYTFLIMANRNDVNMKFLRSLGEVKELTLEELFGY